LRRSDSFFENKIESDAEQKRRPTEEAILRSQARSPETGQVSARTYTLTPQAKTGKMPASN
jgi:hypothetical protein